MKKCCLFFITVLVIVLCQNISCKNAHHFYNEQAEQGFLLSQQYCRSCHQLPDPGLLNKKTWIEYVLPKMGQFLGFRSLGPSSYIGSGHEAMKLEDWNNILLYYYSEAPEKLTGKKRKSITIGLPLFSVDTPAFTVQSPATTMISIDPAARQILFGDGETDQIYQLANGTLKDSIAVGKGISNVQKIDGSLWSLSMGVLHPSDEKSGQLVVINPVTKQRMIVLDSLQRPVHVSYADLNNDNLPDLVLCEFGNLTGALSWYENKGHNKYERHVLRALPGAIKTEVQDFNKDGRPDIIALMAQGDEGFFIYYNLGHGRFREERILQLPPSYGSNSFQLTDFNNDGFADILATNGDNGDYPPLMKPYHGIRLYLNDGKNRFTEKVFLPMNGAGKAIAFDFDQDGDLDIASISYFPDYSWTPEEGFIYWQNDGSNSFTPYSFKDVTAGRWLTMDAGDIDGDGDADIVLGNANFGLGNVPDSLKKKWDKYTPSVLILKNKIY